MLIVEIQYAIDTVPDEGIQVKGIHERIRHSIAYATYTSGKPEDLYVYDADGDDIKVGTFTVTRK